MLARLSRTCSQLADLRWNPSSSQGGNGSEEGNGSQVDVEDDFLPPEATAWPDVSENALEGVAGICGKMFSPLYTYVERTLSADIERLVLALNEVDSELSADSEEDDEDIYVIPFPSDEDEAATLPRLPSDELAEACIESLGNSPAPASRGVTRVPEPSAQQRIPIPRIVITPAPPQQSREMSSCVPVQDTSFGQRLTVPSHTALNACHPPMLPTPYPQAPLYFAVRTWTYRQGHWCADIPGLEEQERRGIFSRPINLRRRAMRKRVAAAARDHSISHTRQNLFARSKRDS